MVGVVWAAQHSAWENVFNGGLLGSLSHLVVYSSVGHWLLRLTLREKKKGWLCRKSASWDEQRKRMRWGAKTQKRSMHVRLWTNADEAQDPAGEVHCQLPYPSYWSNIIGCQVVASVHYPLRIHFRFLNCLLKVWQREGTVFDGAQVLTWHWMVWPKLV